jgi:hypothetical protein
MIEIEVRDGWYIVKGPKMVLLLTRDELIRSLRRGRWWKRRQALQNRLAPQPPGE